MTCNQILNIFLFPLILLYLYDLQQRSECPLSGGELDFILNHTSYIRDPITVNQCPSHEVEVIEVDIKNKEPYKNVGYYFTEETENLVYWWFHFSVTCGSDYVFGPPLFGSQTFLDRTNRINCKFTMFKNAYVSPLSTVFTNQYFIRPVNTTAPAHVYTMTQGRVVGVEPFVISCAIYYVQLNYYHTMLDGISPILLVPEIYRKKAKILFPRLQDYQREFFVALDLIDQVIELNGDEYIYAYRAIIPTHPRTHFVHFGPGLKNISEYLRNKLNVSHILPTKYKFMNRPAGKSRHIPNGDELFEALKKNIPDIPWIMEEDKAKGSIQFAAATHAETLFMITIPGANALKTIFRPPGTVIVFVNTDSWDYGIYLPATSIGQKIVWFMTKAWKHTGKPVDIDPKRFVEACSVGVQYLKDGHWPQPKGNAFIDYYEPNHYALPTRRFGPNRCY